MDPTLTLVAVVLCARLAALAALALRLRARTRYENQRHHTMLTLASRLPSTMLVELVDPHGDGTHLLLRTSTGIEEHRART